MSDLGELDRPGTPASPGPWDARSQEWLVGDGDEGEGIEADGDEGKGAQADEGEGKGAQADDGEGVEVDGTETVVATGDEDRKTARAPEAPSARRQPPAPRRAAADPVKALIHRHRELCERAVGLQARRDLQGVHGPF
ncbi:hypothetical protein HLK59_40115, partial [Streptomyces sp. S3(2020)]|nr:hypothetical protein [Streptomyces sp. S3(2020)]